MNEKIIELAKQSGVIQYDSDGKLAEVNKFAELLIKECIDVLKEWKKEPFPMDGDAVGPILKDYFGMKS